MSLHNNPSDANAWTRRRFLHSGLALASASVTIPHFLQASAYGMAQPAEGMSEIPGVDTDRILVVVQLSGGNDGLNTVVPFRDDDYYRVRPGIAINGDQTLGLDGTMGLHPGLRGLKELYDDGMCSIVQNVGYPNPNRSHFQSMDIWHTADTSGTGDGWLGRYVDSQCCGYGAGESGRTPRAEEDATPQPPSQPPIAIGREAPLALLGRSTKPVAFDSPNLFRWLGSDVHDSLDDPYKKIVTTGVRDEADEHSNAAFLMRTALDAQISSDTIRRAVAQQPLVEYPRSGLAQELSMIGSMIRAGMKTRVYYASHGGFDTHAGQGGANGNHSRLLTEWGDALRAFYADLKAQGNESRVLTVSFSEFGRRVGQNGSGGTDHGTAAPMFLFGPMVRAGLFGSPPALHDLDNGDLKYKIDFRSVYADVLENWLSADSVKVLEERFDPTKLIRA